MSIGRVGNNQVTRQLISQIQSQSLYQERLFEQISSNKRILRASDDPVGTSKAMQIRDQLHRMEEYGNTIKQSNVWTNITVSALDTGVSTWKRVNEVAISAADGTKTAEDRASMAEELEQLLQNMVQVGNTTHGGRYIFSGHGDDTPAFASETDPASGRITGVFYQGDDGERNIQTKDGGTVTINSIGSNSGNPNKPGSFIDSNNNVDVFRTLIDLRDKLLNNDTVGLSGAGGIIEQIEAGANSLTAAQVRLGGTQEILELDNNRLIEENSTIAQFLNDIEQADSVELILELNNVQNVYEAALAAGGRLQQTTLLNYL
jgi:flagellar hook-associated protein 3 FlgL